MKTKEKFKGMKRPMAINIISQMTKACLLSYKNARKKDEKT